MKKKDSVEQIKHAVEMLAEATLLLKEQMEVAKVQGNWGTSEYLAYQIGSLKEILYADGESGLVNFINKLEVK